MRPCLFVSLDKVSGGAVSGRDSSYVCPAVGSADSRCSIAFDGHKGSDLIVDYGILTFIVSYHSVTCHNLKVIYIYYLDV